MAEKEESSGMHQAYNEAINRYSKRLFEFGYRFCQDEDIVKDCIQQLFLDLWNKGFDLKQRATVEPYLLKAIKNRVIREKGKWNHNQSLQPEHDFLLEFSVEQQLISDTETIALAQKVNKLLNTLPARQREIVYLRFYIGLDTTQIAEIMDINKQSAQNLLQKAYQKLRNEWHLILALTVGFTLPHFHHS